MSDTDRSALPPLRVLRPLRRLVRALLPGGAVVGAALLVATTGALGEAVLPWLTRYGAVVFAVGAGLAVVFHRSRAFIALGMLGAAYLAGSTTPLPTSDRVAVGSLLLLVTAVLALLRDRGVLSRVGLAQVLTLAALGAGGAWLGTRPASLLRFADAVARMAQDNVIVRLVTDATAGVRGAFGQALSGLQPLALGLMSTVWPGVSVGLVALAVLCSIPVVRAVVRFRGPVERALAWTFVLSLPLVHPATPPTVVGILLVSAAFVLALGVIEASYVMAYRDELTGLPGRRALMHQLGEAQGLYTLAMVDVDHFKAFNDKHGHDVGDQVLKLVAARLADVGGGGRAYRYGGEEFTLLFTGRSVSDARPHLDDVRASVADAPFTVRSWKRPARKPESGSAPRRRGAEKVKTLSVAVSIGAADSATESDPAAILKRADQALYRAKKAGRNRVSITGVRGKRGARRRPATA